MNNFYFYYCLIKYDDFEKILLLKDVLKMVKKIVKFFNFEVILWVLVEFKMICWV